MSDQTLSHLALVVDEAPIALPGWSHNGRCRAKEHGTSCPHPAIWSLILECSRCGQLGSGPACDFHKRQADEWGIPHRLDEGSPCDRQAQVISAVKLA